MIKCYPNFRHFLVKKWFYSQEGSTKKQVSNEVVKQLRSAKKSQLDTHQTEDGAVLQMKRNCLSPHTEGDCQRGTCWNPAAHACLA